MDNSIFDLSGRVAIVTGGNGGIGLGIAEGLACAGASVSIVGRDEAKTAAAVERLRGHGVEALGFAADVSDEAAVDEVVASTAERLGRIDILVNNAGIAKRGLLQDYTSEDWDRVVDVNLKGMFLFSRAVYPHMVRAGGGKVINIGSMTSIFGLDWAPAYGASKGGAVQLAKNMAVAWAQGQHPGQHDPARLDRDGPHGAAADDRPRAARVDQLPDTAGALGYARRFRRGRGLPGQQRVGLRHRGRHPG